MLAIGIWVNYGTLDIVTAAEGVVVPSKKIQKIQHLEGGIIRSIEVTEGQLVKNGDPLIILETTASESELNEIQSMDISKSGKPKKSKRRKFSDKNTISLNL